MKATLYTIVEEAPRSPYEITKISQSRRAFVIVHFVCTSVGIWASGLSVPRGEHELPSMLLL